MTTPAQPTLSTAVVGTVIAPLAVANRSFMAHYPGESPARQPLHTVYGGAHLFKAGTAAKLGSLALRSIDGFAADWTVFARALELPGVAEIPADAGPLTARLEADAEAVRAELPGAWLAWTVYHRVREKLTREAVEDFRIDFEDGYGNRPDAEEDATAVEAATEVAAGIAQGVLPPFIGIRTKPFTEELKARSMRTLDLFLTTLVGATGGRLPDNFVVTLPKVQIPEQVTALVSLFEHLEEALGLATGSLQLELMIEVTQSILDRDGRTMLPQLLAAAQGRCRGAHFGTYDYTATCNITAAHQRMDHPVCDFAKHMMQVAYAGTGLMLSDGATTVMPITVHRGADLTTAQREENTAAVHRAWKLAYDNVRHSLEGGYYQGWDLHPGQLPVRYGACFAFFLEGMSDASARLANFIRSAAQATLVGDVFDDAATGQGLLNYFLRALNSGAVTLEEVQAVGLTLEEIQSRSFVKILANRRGA